MVRKVRGLPRVERSCEVLAWAEHSELLEFVICVVEHDVVAQMFLKLSEKASCETWVLLEVCCAKSPLVL